MTRALWQQGALVNDQWRLERPLGEGAMSRVWEAESLRLGGRVAIKFLAHEHSANEAARTRFTREARAICKVRSQHVVQVLDHGVSHGVPFLVMELLEGEDLARMLERDKTVSLLETASIIDQLCRGLEKAHGAGFVHRDIKPENVFVIHENDGGHFVKLLDFGIAKQLDTRSVPLTQQDTILGTAHYLSPEQIDAPASIDARTDIWSVGVLAYQMLIGKRPFDAAAWPELCARILSGRFTAPSAERSGLPAELDAWFSQALHRDRRERFGSAQAAGAALSGIARAHATSVRRRDAGLPVSAERSNEHARPAGVRTQQVRLVAAASLVLLASLGAWFAWSASRPATTLPQPSLLRPAPVATRMHAAAQPPATDVAPEAHAVQPAAAGAPEVHTVQPAAAEVAPEVHAAQPAAAEVAPEMHAAQPAAAPEAPIAQPSAADVRTLPARAAQPAAAVPSARPAQAVQPAVQARAAPQPARPASNAAAALPNASITPPKHGPPLAAPTALRRPKDRGF